MSQWLARKDLCQRCFSGIDDDHDGNCHACAKLSDGDSAWMKQTRLRMELTGSGQNDARLQAVKDVLGMLTDEGGKIFSPSSLDAISKSVLFWIDQVKHPHIDSDRTLGKTSWDKECQESGRLNKR